MVTGDCHRREQMSRTVQSGSGPFRTRLVNVLTSTFFSCTCALK